MPQLEVKPVQTAVPCEEKGCHENAKWRVSLGRSIFFWCGVHTRERMSDVELWLSLRERQGAVRRT